MHISLTLERKEKVVVYCDREHSHSFSFLKIREEFSEPLCNPSSVETAGRELYNLLFPAKSLCERLFMRKPECLYIIAEHSILHEPPWEALHGPNGLVALTLPIVRFEEGSSHAVDPKLQAHVIVAVPSAPLMQTKLDVPGEYDRLREAVFTVKPSFTIARSRPASIQRLAEMAAHHSPVIIHFIGHGGFSKDDGTPFIQFEKENGEVSNIDAVTMAQSIRGHTALILLNACSMARAPGDHQESFAQTLVKNNIPRVIAMQGEITDEAALVFTRAFYGLLAAGISVEEALCKSRVALRRGGFHSAVHLPVLYASTTLTWAPARATCGPMLVDPLPRRALRAIPKPEGVFVGRQKELRQLGSFLTVKGRPSQLITIVGSGGEGKTALARAACERFAFSFPGGLFAVNIAPTSSRESVVLRLAVLLDENPVPYRGSIEDAVLDKLGQDITLVVVDGIEVILDQLDHPENSDARRTHDLMSFLTQDLRERVSVLLFTSRRPTGRAGEQVIQLSGLEIPEGATLFLQCAPRWSSNPKLLRRLIDLEVKDWDIQSDLQSDRMRQRLGLDTQTADVVATAIEVSRRVQGHPLCLRLLGHAFDTSSPPPASFLAEHNPDDPGTAFAEVLSKATDRFKEPGNPHRTIHACIKASAEALSPRHLELLCSLRMLTGYVIPEVVVAAWEGPEVRSSLEYRGVLLDLGCFENLQGNCISLNPYHHEFQEESPIYQMLHELWRRSLLSRHELQARSKGNAFAAIVYRLVPAVWSYLQTEYPISVISDTHAAEMAEAHGPLADALLEVSVDPVKAMIASECIDDLVCLADSHGNQSWPRFFSSLSVILGHLGRQEKSREYADKAVEAATTNATMATNREPVKWPHDSLDMEMEAALARAQAAIRQGKIEEGLRLLDVLLSRSRATNKNEITVEVQLTTAHALLTSGELKGALSIFKTIEHDARRRKDWQLCAAALDGITVVHLGRNKPHKALRAAKRAHKTFTRPIVQPSWQASDRDISTEANILHNLAEAQRLLKQFKEAEKNYKKALRLRRQSKSDYQLPVTLYNLAQTYRELHKTNETLHYLILAQEASHAVENWAAQAAILIAIAEVEGCKPGRHEELLLEATEYAERSGNVALHAFTHGVLALAFCQSGDRHADAHFHLGKVLKLLCEAGLDQDAGGTTVKSYLRLVKELKMVSPKL